MTVQICDIVLYRNGRCPLRAVNGSGLFDPAQQGVNPGGFTTDCWRGYHCSYLVADGLLFLTKVNLWLSKEDMATASRGEGPKLFGKVPRRYFMRRERTYFCDGELKTSWESSDFMVEGLREKVPFTGGLLLSDEIIREISARMAFMVFDPLYKSRVIHELIFDAGRLIEEHHRLARTLDWIEGCFKLEYPGFSA